MEDLRQDNVLATRLSSFRKLRPEHLDIPTNIFYDPSCNLAVEELKKMNNYKTPRDKMICISNCCKIIFNVLTRVNPKEAPSADSFLPVLIFLVMRANPPHLHSNLKYIMEYRNPEKMISEAGYFLTNLQSTIMFWSTVDHTSLSIDKNEFEKLINGQYFTESDEEVDNLLSASPKLNSDFIKKEYDSSDDDQGESTIDSDATMTPLAVSHLEDGIEMESQTSSGTPPTSTSTTSFPMTPLSRSEKRLSLEDRSITTESSISPIQQLMQNMSVDQFKFAQVESVNDLRIGDLDKLLSEYKQLHQLFMNVRNLVHDPASTDKNGN